MTDDAKVVIRVEPPSQEVLDELRDRLRQKWEYMILCPDSNAGRAVLLQDVGEEGWEAVCSWAEIVTTYGLDDFKHERRVNHILFKRPA
jgi:hypothetical protein